MIQACWSWAVQLSQGKDYVHSKVFPQFCSSSCNLCLTEGSASIVEVTAPPSEPAISWICARKMSPCFALVPKQYGRAGGLKVSSPYITCWAFILMTAGPEMPVRDWASVLVMCQSSVSLLSVLFRFFLDGSADLFPLIIWWWSLLCRMGTLFIWTLFTLCPRVVLWLTVF